ncbi:nicotinamide mononucleotide transporter [Serratia fonticola]|nr:nicotinamide mononucleotide transporter [Serratia fonticola]
MPLIEIAASTTYAASVWITARNNVHTWWIGIVDSLLYGWVFFSVQLYASRSRRSAVSKLPVRQ